MKRSRTILFFSFVIVATIVSAIICRECFQRTELAEKNYRAALKEKEILMSSPDYIDNLNDKKFTVQLEAIQAKAERERDLRACFSEYNNRFGLMTFSGAVIIICSGVIHLLRRMGLT